MVGNDVVDLKLAKQQSDWRKRGFLDKVFTGCEQQLIKDTSDPDETVWLLWSMKEAAYKAHQRRFQLLRKLNWLAQRCSALKIEGKKAAGIVEINGFSYACTSEINCDYIFTSSKNLSKIPVKNVILETSSTAVKKELLKYVAAQRSLNVKELVLKKNKEGVPNILFKNDILNTCFSLSGHGRFNAFSLAVNDV